MNVEILNSFFCKTGFVMGVLILFSYMLSSCGTEANFDDPEELANTIWKLDYIQAEEGSVFSRGGGKYVGFQPWILP